MVLDLMIKDGGGDRKIESKNRICFRAPSEEECLDRDDTTETDEIGEIEAEAD